MGLENRQVLIVSLSSLFFFFFYSAEATNFVDEPPYLADSSPASTPFSSPSPAEAALEPAPFTNENRVVIDPTITTACSGTDYPDLCLSSIQPYLNGEADLITILEFEIKASKARAIAVSAQAKKMAMDPTTNAETVSFLKDCNEMYSDALDNFQEAEEAMKIRDIGTINSMLSAALSDFSTCDDMASESQGSLEMPFSSEGATLQQLSSNCLAIASMVNW